MIALVLQREAPAGVAWLGPDERSRLDNMRFEARRADFLLGRWTAKRALAAVLGCAPDSRLEVRAAASGKPEAFHDGDPVPLAVSISHRAGLAVAAVGRAPLGVDLELIEPRSDAFVRDFLTPDEARLVLEGRPHLVANLIWSAKESALKARGDGLRADTRSVEVKLGPVRTGLWQPLTAGGAGGFWCTVDQHVVTVVGASEPRWIHETIPAAAG